MMRPFVHSNVRRQSGAVLFVALVFLVLLTLLALTATGTSILQERMTGGLRNQQLGFMAAETGLRGGESFLWNISFAGSNPLPPCDQSTSGTCAYGRELGTGLSQSTAQMFRTSRDWNGGSLAAGVREYSGLSDLSSTAKLASNPRYLIEELGDDVPFIPRGIQSGAIDPQIGSPTTNKLYRITTRSQGGSAAAVRVAESIYSASPFGTLGHLGSSGGGEENP